MPTECSTLASKCPQELMDRHGVPRHKEAGVVTAVLGLSRSHGNRKLRGIAPMTFNEVGRIAGHFGETLSQALEPSLAHGLERAVMMVGELEVPCEVSRGSFYSLHSRTRRSLPSGCREVSWWCRPRH